MNYKFDAVLGQHAIKKLIAHAIEQKRLAHAFLCIGPEGTGKLALALEMAKALLCEAPDTRPCGRCGNCRKLGNITHPNLTVLFPYPKSAKENELTAVRQSIAENPYHIKHGWPTANISIDSIRELKRALGLKSYQGQARLIILVQAQQMTAEATNALLKILEEPPEKTYFLLTVTEPERLLPTVLSRCQQLRFNSLPAQEIAAQLAQRTETDAAARELAARLANGSMRRAYELLEEDVLSVKKQAVELMRAAIKSPSSAAVFAVELTHKHDRVFCREILQALLIWIRDVFLMATLGPAQAKSRIANPDEASTIEKFAVAYPAFDFHRAIAEIETALRMLDRYVQPASVLLVMMNNLRILAARGAAPKAA